MNNEPPPALIEAFKRETVVPFVGSGLSRAAGLPGWRNLLDDLAHSLLDHRDVLQHFNALDPIQQAQLLYDEVDRAQVVSAVCRMIAAEFEPVESHRLLVSLPARTVITTNWDRLIERAYERYLHSSIPVVWKDDQISMSNGTRTLIKLHGAVEDPASLIFAEEDYYNVATAESLLYLYMRIILATSTVLFIGYSFSDFDFRLLHTFVARKLGWTMSKAFIFLPNATNQHVNYFRKRNLRPIVYTDKDPTEATRRFLADLYQETAVSATDNHERLQIMRREHMTLLRDAPNLLIRNHSNLGPLAFPPAADAEDSDSKGSGPAASWRTLVDGDEGETAASWRSFLDKGARAKCIVCLNTSWLHEYAAHRGKERAAQRLRALSDNLIRYSNQVEIVDIGIPTNINIDIYGTKLCLESKKTGFQTKPYNRITVIRNNEHIRERVTDFDSVFEEIRAHNLIEARGTSPTEYFTARIARLLSSM